MFANVRYWRLGVTLVAALHVPRLPDIAYRPSPSPSPIALIVLCLP